MSYSVTFVGAPEAVKRALNNHSGSLSGNDKVEFDDVLPALKVILDQNTGGNNGKPYCLRLEASGHATFDKGVKTYGNCTIHVTPLGLIAE